MANDSILCLLPSISKPTFCSPIQLLDNADENSASYRHWDKKQLICITNLNTRIILLNSGLAS